MFTALRFREFRLFWGGLVTQIIGSQMFQFTLGFLAFDLSDSSVMLGLVLLAGAVPRVALVIFGGVLADRWDQRRIISYAQAVSATMMAVLATLTLFDLVKVWHLALASFFVGAVQAIDEPSRTAFFPRLLPDRSYIPSAVPLFSIAWSSTRLFAPSIAGVVVASAGADASFYISAVTAGVMFTVMQLLRPGESSSRSKGSMLKNLAEGVAYVRGEEIFFKIISVAFVHATFVMGYVFMLPVFAKDVLDVDAARLGVLTSAPGVGSLIGLVTFNWIHRRFADGTVMILGLTLFSASLIGFANSDWYWASWGLLAVVGMAHIYYQTSSQVVLQTLVPEELRGRVMSLYAMLWSLMLLGGTLLNFVAGVLGPERTLTGGAVIVLLYTWLVVFRSPTIRHLSMKKRAEASREAAEASVASISPQGEPRR